MKHFALILLVSILSLEVCSQEAEVQKEFLSLFAPLDLPFTLEAEEYGIKKPAGEGISSEFQKKFMDLAGHNEDGYGTHVTAIGKLDLGKGKFALVYSYTVVPVPAVFDETVLMIYDTEEGKIDDLDLAYIRGAVGDDISTLTCTIEKQGKDILIHQKLKVKTTVETDDGLEEGPIENYIIQHKIKKGKLTKGSREKQ